ncbi:MAG: FecR domain-containing protein [Candidatus Sericytochromatia bacterium]
MRFWFGILSLVMAVLVLSGAQVVPISGTARVTLVAGSANVRKSQLVSSGFRLKTGSNGRVELTFSSGHKLRVGPRSDLTLVAYQNRRTLVKVANGRVWNQVQPRSGQQVVVRSRHTTAAVLGTVYDVAVSEDHTQTTVLEGSVGVHRPEDENPEQLFEHLPILPAPTATPASTGFSAPVEVASPVHEIQLPLRVVPGPYEVPVDQWLQLIANQQIAMGNTGSAQIRSIDPQQLQQQDEWVRWNRQLDTAQ